MLAENHHTAFCVHNNANVFLVDFKWQFIGAEGIVGTNRPRVHRVHPSVLTKVDSRKDLPKCPGSLIHVKAECKTGRYCV